ncbi:hypothetical protein [Corynebacterium sp. BF-R-2]|uniref:hypothetical protein n=1 Tax=Corynebacterium sp. BF-R-2 TaxID=2943494 RepID=UPI00211E9B4E|nr:hypothetical protein [Corynebacterium sp. BF-R-2]MCQ9677423.1 hypothetical protein [Corynebacterium sp. BF-R-2]
MKISRSLVAAALSGALVLGGTTAAIAQIPEAADSTVVALPASIVVDGVTYYKDTTVDEGKGDYKSADGKQTLPYLVVKGIVDSRNASESEETTEAKETTTEKTSEPKETTSATKSSEASESTSATKSSEASESTSATKSSEASESTSATKSSEASETNSASQTSEPSESQSAEPTPTDEPGDKKSSARDALSSKDGKPTPLAIFGIVAGVLAAVAAAFPVIAKTLNLNIKLPF